MEYPGLRASRFAGRIPILAWAAVYIAGAHVSAAWTSPSFSLPPASMFGSTGLISIPIGEVVPYGQYTLGINRLEHEYRPYPDEPGDTVTHFVTVGVLPQVEVSANVTNHDGKLGIQFRETLAGGYGGWNFDRMLSIQLLLIRQVRGWPFSLAAGAQDAFGTGVFQSRYLTASRRWPGFGVHFGAGTGRLSGPFGGIDLQATPGVRVMLEHDGRHINAGMAVEIRRFSIAPVLSGLRALGGGISYHGHL